LLLRVAPFLVQTGAYIIGQTQLSLLLLLPAGRLLLLQGPLRTTVMPAQSASQALL
jgi:hypothetical protein